MGISIILISMIATVVSTGLSIAYYQGLQFGEVSLVVVAFIILLQLMVFLGSVSKGIIYERTPQHYYTVIFFTKVCFVISVLSTISFFNAFEKVQRTEVVKELLYSIPFLNLNHNNWLVVNLTNLTLVWGSCIVIDLMSMYFPAIGSDMVSGISTRKKLKIKDKNYFTKIYELLMYYPKMFIDKKCIQLGIIEADTPDTLSDTKLNTADTTDTKSDTLLNVLNTKLNTKPDTTDTKLNTLDTKSIGYKKLNTLNTADTKPDTKSDTNPIQLLDLTKKIEYKPVVSPDTSPDTLDTKLDTTDTKSDTIYKRADTKLDTLDTKPDTFCPDTKQRRFDTMYPIHDTKPDTLNTNPDTLDTISEIDQYIVSNYKVGDKINVSEVKSKFGYKPQDRNWNDKIRNSLTSAKIIDTRLTRIQVGEERIHAVK